MIRDPLYRDIERALKEPLDGNLFERCAWALLREDGYPVVPVRGGNDAGHDGAIADGQGEAFPVVTTTSKQVYRNLRDNLESAKRNGKHRREVVFATSVFLTPLQRRKLEAIAREMQFTLVQVHDGAYFAELLYSNPKWCHELLGLVGDPSPFSIRPPGARRMLDCPPIGREQELAWLAEGQQDLLLIGQPGSGKTFLHGHLARQGQCLFAVESDSTKLAQGLRRHRPSTIVVDDAHTRLPMIDALRQLRAEMGTSFRIVSNCWPSTRNEVARRMDIDASGCMELELLSRVQIVEVVHAAGLGGPGRLISLILDQAEGRPGLAVTLARIALERSIKPVWEGSALLDWMRRQADEEDLAMLAAIAVGGDSGMVRDQVAELLGVSSSTLWARAAKLQPGGILLDLGDGRLQVRPPPLRSALVREVLFSQSPPFSVEDSIHFAASAEQTARVLLEARATGGRVPDRMLLNLLRACSRSDLWSYYASLGQETARQVLREQPPVLGSAAPGLLLQLPVDTVPFLLAEAEVTTTRENSDTAHPLRRLQEWVDGDQPHDVAAVERKRILLTILERWSGRTSSARVLHRAISIVLRPQFHMTKAVPGSGNEFQLIQGSYADKQVREIAALWPRCLTLLAQGPALLTGDLKLLIHGWAYPAMPKRKGSPPPPTCRFMRATAQRMLADLVEAKCFGSAFNSWARGLSKHAGLRLTVAVDAVFDLLYADDLNDSDWRAVGARKTAQIAQLAQAWAERPPRDVVKELAAYEVEAGAGEVRPRFRWSWNLCQELAQGSVNPLEWASELLANRVSPDLVQRFVTIAVERRVAGCDKFLARCLEIERYRWMAMEELFATPEVAPQAVERAIELLAEWSVEHLDFLLVRTTSINLRRRLLAHPVEKIRTAMTVAEWHREHPEKIHADLRGPWRAAVVSVDRPMDYAWGEVVRWDPSLASEWLERQLQAVDNNRWHGQSHYAEACAVLDSSRRKQLLNLLPANRFTGDLLEHLLRKDSDVYRHLLANKSLAPLHLQPLHRDFDAVWVEYVQAALASGYSVAVLCQNSMPRGWPCGSEGESYWRKLMERLKPLAVHQDRRMQEIVRDRLEWVQSQLRQWRSQQRLEEVYGLRY